MDGVSAEAGGNDLINEPWQTRKLLEHPEDKDALQFRMLHPMLHPMLHSPESLDHEEA